VIDAVLSAAATDVEGAINIGSGVETSLLDLLNGIIEAGASANGASGNGSAAPEPEFLPARRDEVKRNAVDTSRAAELIGWNATTALEDGLRITLDSL
jgi:UDP-glucose 4-epimerase